MKPPVQDRFGSRRGVRTVRGASWAGAIAVVVLLVGFQGSPFWLNNLTIVAITAISVVGLVVLVGHTGQVSFAQTAFMACGGYGVAILTVRYGWNVWAALAIAVAIAVAFSLIVGLPSFRLQGHYFAVGTFALALAISSWAVAANDITSGAIGIPGVPGFAIGGLDGARWSYALSWILLALLTAAAYLLLRSRIGLTWNMIRANERVASSLGVRPLRFKMLAFAFSAFAGALSGALYVGFNSYVSPDLYSLEPMLDVYFVLFLGGYKLLLGPILGAAFVQLVPQYLPGVERYQDGIFVLILLVLLRVSPDGLPDAGQRLGRAVRRGISRIRRRRTDGQQQVAHGGVAEP